MSNDSVAQPTFIPSGQTIGHFRLIEPLGQGGMGQVYLAEDLNLGRRVALKLLPPAAEDNADMLRRLEREAKTVAALNHPNIVTLYSVERHQDRTFLTMELIEGSRLDDLIPPGGTPLERFFPLAIGITNAVAAAHQAGITHRDLKPANVMVTGDSWVKVLDFGLAKQLPPSGSEADATRTLTEQGSIVGTVPYMSPEQLKGQPVTSASDVFSLGIVFYEMLSGKRPFEASTNAELVSAILRDQPKPLTQVKVDLPNELGAVVARCLHKNRAQRYQNAGELRDALIAVRDRVAGGRPALAGGWRSKRVALVAAAAALGISLVAGWWLTRRPQPQGPADERAAPIAVLDQGTISLAVLPLEVRGAGSDPTFATGLVQDLIARLSALEGLTVAPRTATLRAAAAGKPLPAVARELGVNHLLTGVLTWKVDERLNRVASLDLQLIEASTQRAVWSQGSVTDLRAISSARENLSHGAATGITEHWFGVAGEDPEQAPAVAAVPAPVAGPAARSNPGDAPRPATSARPAAPRAGTAVRPHPAGAPAGGAKAAGGGTASTTRLDLTFESALAAGVITVYAGADRIYRRDFRFRAEDRGPDPGRAGGFEDALDFENAGEPLRIYVAARGQKAQYRTVAPPAAERHLALRLTLLADGDVRAELVRDRKAGARPSS